MEHGDGPWPCSMHHGWNQHPHRVTATCAMCPMSEAEGETESETRSHARSVRREREREISS